jgi:hypothetical protein
MRMFRSIRFWQLSAVALALLLVGSAVGVAVAGGTETRAGTVIKAVKILRSESGGDVDLSGSSPVVGSTTIGVPAGTKAILLITFSAETSCYDASGWCGLDILVNGSPAFPDGDFAFDSSDGGTESQNSYESHSIQRSTNILNPGSYTVTAQFYNGSGGPTIWWDDWQLTVERIFKPS